MQQNITLLFHDKNVSKFLVNCQNLLNVLDPAAGASDDWYKGSLGARYAFTTELRDTGYHGFELPADQIIPSGEEIMAGMKVVFNKIIQDSKKP